MAAANTAGTAGRVALSRRTLVTITLVAVMVGAAAGFVIYAVNQASNQKPNGGVAVQPASTVLRNGDVAPVRFRLDRLGGGSPVELASLTAGHPAVINLFASWCTACAAELKAFGAVWHADRDHVAFVGVDTNDPSPDQALAISHAAGARYPLLSDTASLEVAQAFGIGALPVTFFISASGKVAGEVLGAESAATLRARLADLLANRAIH